MRAWGECGAGEDARKGPEGFEERCFRRWVLVSPKHAISFREFSVLRPSLRRLLPLALTAAPAVGCVGLSGDMEAYSPGSETLEPATSSSPSWDGRPASWAKLIEIEDWLAASDRRRNESFVGEAELQLAEGRLALSRREVSRLAGDLMTLRLNSAKAGFQRALARSDLDPRQRRRAEKGLEELRKRHDGLYREARRSSGLEIRTRDRWGAKAPVAARLTRRTQAWNRITVHHSAEHSRDQGSQAAPEVADVLRRIQGFQMRERGFGDIGYHFLVDPKGRIWQGRPLEWQGAHSKGPNNVANIGVCLLGHYDLERPTRASLVSLEELLSALGQRHKIPRSRVYGHDHWKATECPGENLNAWLVSYRSNVAPPRTAQ